MGNKFEYKSYDNRMFKENLEFLIKENSTTKSQIEEKINIGVGSLSRYCAKNNSPKPSIDILMSIANGFGITIDELINTDLKEKKKIKDINKEGKEIRVCEKLINQTNENLVFWQKYPYCWDTGICEEILIENPVDNRITFKIRDINKEYDIDEIDIVHAEVSISKKMHLGLEVCIIRVLSECDSEYFAYELFLKRENGNVIKGASSYVVSFDKISIDNEVHSILDKLYDSAEFYINHGKERFEREKIFEEFLNDEGYEVEELDMPF